MRVQEKPGTKSCTGLCLGKSATVIKWLTEGVELPLETWPEALALGEYFADATQSVLLGIELSKLLRLGAIRARRKIPRIIMPIFGIPKEDGSLRLIHDEREINRLLPDQTFSLETLRVAKELLKRGDWMVALDQRMGYYAIPVKEEFQTLLGFRFGGPLEGEESKKRWRERIFTWQCLPMGNKLSGKI